MSDDCQGTITEAPGLVNKTNQGDCMQKDLFLSIHPTGEMT